MKTGGTGSVSVRVFWSRRPVGDYLMESPGDIYAITWRKPHIALLGAGASRAAFLDGDKYGRQLPTMPKFVEVVEGLASYLKDNSLDRGKDDIEDLYSDLSEQSGTEKHLRNINDIIYRYFATMQLPENPTLYDLLILSLRSEDMIATINWDPHLPQTYRRLFDRYGKKCLPHISYLHGNVGIFYCDSTDHDKLVYSDQVGCCTCGKRRKPYPLLYPIRHKNYSKDTVISTFWHNLRTWLKRGYMFTIFGYSKPTTDTEAVALMRKAWGEPDKRAAEQIAIIDVLDSNTLRERWEDFICREHYASFKSWYHSYLAKHPRRSCDAFFDAYMQGKPRLESPIPKDASWEELDNWLKPYLVAEDGKA